MKAKNILFLIVFTAIFSISACSPSACSAVPYDRGNTDSNGVSLMVNVYEGSDVVLKMLSVFAEYGAVATFFVGGAWADDNVEVLREMLSGGHELGNHGYFHKDCDRLTDSQLSSEVFNCHNLVELCTGYKMRLFAPPSGAYDSRTVAFCDSVGYKLILWTKDTVDWRDRDAKLIFTRATKGVSGGDFILMHPTKATLEALPAVLQYYREHGLRAVSVSQNLQ